MYFIWKPDYVFDIKEIDEQHKHFVGILDRMYDSTIQGLHQEELGDLLKELADYASDHFATEEKYFDKFDYPEAVEHKAKHQELRDKIQDFIEEAKNNKVDISNELLDFLEDWLVDHLLNLDKKYVECFHSHGLY